MSYWIKLHGAAFANPKTRRMAKRLGIPPAAAVGHLASLWTWALEYAPDGDLARFDGEEVEIAAGWEGEDGAFIAAATTAGYLDCLGPLADGSHLPRLGFLDFLSANLPYHIFQRRNLWLFLDCFCGFLG